MSAIPENQGKAGGGEKETEYPTEPSGYQWIGTMKQSMNESLVLAFCKSKEHNVVIKITQVMDTKPKELEKWYKSVHAVMNLSHNNLLSPAQAFFYKSSFWTVYPRYSGGPIHEILNSHYKNGLEDESVTARILLDIAQGLQFLHENQICHRNIRASSFHLDRHTGICKLGDFEDIKEVRFDKKNRMNSTVFDKSKFVYTDPFLLNSNKSGKQNPYRGDIYSFGITALELAFGVPPVSLHQANHQFVTEKDAPAKPVDFDELYPNRPNPFSTSFAELIKDTTIANEKRIKASELVKHSAFKKAASHQKVATTLGILVKTTESRVNEKLIKPADFDDESALEDNTPLSVGWDYSIHLSEPIPEEDESQSPQNGQPTDKKPQKINISVSDADPPSLGDGPSDQTPTEKDRNDLPHPPELAGSDSEQSDANPLMSPQKHRGNLAPISDESCATPALTSMYSDGLMDHARQHSDSYSIEVQTPSAVQLGRFKVQNASRNSHSQSDNRKGDSPSNTLNEEYSLSESARSDDDQPVEHTIGRFHVQKVGKAEVNEDLKSHNAQRQPDQEAKNGANAAPNDENSQAQNQLPPRQPSEDQPLVDVPAKVEDWSNEDVIRWTNSLAETYSQYSEHFKTHDIDGAVLQEMDDQMLQEIGVDKKVHRKVILNKLAKLKTAET